MAKIFNIDVNLFNADWTKRTWTLPPYKSAEFFLVIPRRELRHFKTLPIYKFAVNQGLIIDDEWAG